MAFLKVLLPMLLMVIVILFVYNVLKIYVLEKIKINKWIVLLIAALVFAVPNLIWPQKIYNTMWQYVQTGVFLIFFLWFMDLAGLNKKRSIKENPRNATIKSKAKPNRVNNNNMEVIKNSKKNKKKRKK